MKLGCHSVLNVIFCNLRFKLHPRPHVTQPLGHRWPGHLPAKRHFALSICWKVELWCHSGLECFSLTLIYWAAPTVTGERIAEEGRGELNMSHRTIISLWQWRDRHTGTRPHTHSCSAADQIMAVCNLAVKLNCCSWCNCYSGGSI